MSKVVKFWLISALILAGLLLLGWSWFSGGIEVLKGGAIDTGRIDLF